MSNGPLANLAKFKDAKSKRISSYDRTGGNGDYVPIEPGATLVMGEIEGSGAITHIWITISTKDELFRKNLVLRMFWDGQEHPSVEAPIGDFFGQGWGLKYKWASLPLAAAPRDGNALVCYFPMPFGKGARIEVENQSDVKVDSFYYYLDYEEREVDEDEGRFHAWYNQELTKPESATGDVENEWGIFDKPAKNTTDEHNYLICDAEGRGHFVGVNYYVHCPTPIWYGEGDDMWKIDGEEWPFSLHGTGTEDYFNQSWSPDDPYQHPYFGTARAPGFDNDSPRFGWLGRTHCYRFHVEDPVRFTKSLRFSIEAGHANCLTLELATVAYWYQTLPSQPFPPMPSAEERKPMPEMRHVDSHSWRERWRQVKGGGKLWGNE